MKKYATILIYALLAAAITMFIMGCAQSPVAAAPETPETPEEHAAHDPAEQDESHDDHEGHGEEGVVELSDAQMNELGIKTAVAGPGDLSVDLSLVGEVRLNEDRTAHVVPRMAGVVKQVFKSMGDKVKAGEPLAVLESRELADAKADHLAARARLKLAEQILTREEDLWKKRISAEQDYLQAQQAVEEARISARASEQKLHALGVSETGVKAVASEPEAYLTKFTITAPFDGTVIQKHITLGEYLEPNADCFTLADLSTVWVDVNVHKKDLPMVKAGQSVTVAAQGAAQPASATIAFVAPIVGEDTRTAIARILLDNPSDEWRPGLFVTVAAAVDQKQAAIVVPQKALITLEDGPHVFVRDEHGFEPRPVTTGQAAGGIVEVLSGLAAGETYAAEGAYTLKAELDKAGMAGDGHLGHQH